ncbi:MAG: VOC family protein [Amnibacterium sp.]
MPTRLNPYLGFRGNAREAMEFYARVLGGTLTVSTFADFHASQDPAEDDQVMHAQIDTASGLTLMGSDTPSRMPYNPGDTMSVSLSGEDEAELRRYWDGLADGATILQPLAAAPWGGSFGMLKDRYGITWLLNINAA